MTLARQWTCERARRPCPPSLFRSICGSVPSALPPDLHVIERKSAEPRYVKAYNLTEESRTELRKAAFARAIELKLAPSLTGEEHSVCRPFRVGSSSRHPTRTAPYPSFPPAVPAEVNGTKVPIEMYTGEQPEMAVDRFLEYQDLKLGPEDRLALIEEVRRTAVDLRMLPALQLEVQLRDRDRPAMFTLFKGDNLTAAIAQFAETNQIQGKSVLVPDELASGPPQGN